MEPHESTLKHAAVFFFIVLFLDVVAPAWWTAVTMLKGVASPMIVAVLAALGGAICLLPVLLLSGAVFRGSLRGARIASWVAMFLIIIKVGNGIIGRVLFYSVDYVIALFRHNTLNTMVLFLVPLCYAIAYFAIYRMLTAQPVQEARKGSGLKPIRPLSALIVALMIVVANQFVSSLVYNRIADDEVIQQAQAEYGDQYEYRFAYKRDDMVGLVAYNRHELRHVAVDMSEAPSTPATRISD